LVGNKYVTLQSSNIAKKKKNSFSQSKFAVDDFKRSDPLIKERRLGDKNPKGESKKKSRRGHCMPFKSKQGLNSSLYNAFL
jgi:hypothetical protein